MKIYLAILSLWSVAVLAKPQSQNPPTGQQFVQQPVEELKPYSFAWTASRHYNGIPDREHTEERGEDGITRGVFRYVDPLKRIQEVVYVSDDYGFHVQASNLPQDTKVVKAAKQKHQTLFEKIAADHARIAAEREQPWPNP